MKIGIVGRKKDTGGYEQFFTAMNIPCITSLSIGTLSACQALLFPGGGDITPELFGEPEKGSRNMDTELDILQLQAFQYALWQHLPVLGICKGMQLINVALGGTIIQDLDTSSIHTCADADLYHETITKEGSFLHTLYGSSFPTNSRHHQAINRPGSSLLPIQWCPADHCIEGIEHTTLPIWGVQWHPERLSPTQTTISAVALFSYFLSYV